MTTAEPAPSPAPAGPEGGWYRKKPIPVRADRWWRNGDHPDDRAPRLLPDPNGTRTVQTETGPIRCEMFTPEHQAAHDWEGQVVRRFRHPDIPGTTPCGECGLFMDVHGWIDTLEGGHRVCPGDWILTGIAGEHYPCKNSVFEQTYEPVSDEGPER